MALADVFAEAEAYASAQVTAETWGHLAPQPGRWYDGTVLFAHSVYGGDGTTAIDTDFGDLDGGPWFYNGMHEMLLDHHTSEGEGGVYRWTGKYMLRVTQEIQNDDGDIMRPGHHEHVWIGEFETLIPPGRN